MTNPITSYIRNVFTRPDPLPAHWASAAEYQAPDAIPMRLQASSNIQKIGALNE